MLGPADKPSTGQITAEVMRRFKLKALFCPPNIFEQLLQESDAIEQAKELEFILYAGGPLTTATGTALSKVTDVCQFYGSTETIPVQTLVPLPEDWDTLEWHPLFGADMQPSVDDAYELVLHRDSKFEGIRGLDCNFPNIEEWRTKDLFRSHPTKPNLWRFHGRLDDIIVLSNGEKFNPVPSEAIINSHPLVSAVLIVGQGRFQAALLIESVRTDKPQSTLIEELWPTIEKANAQAQSHGRIIRTMIAIADPSKPFERAGKGTVVRKLTADKFSEEIAALYLANEPGNLQAGPKLSDRYDVDRVQDFVRQAVAFSFPMNDVKSSDDLYVHGLDSLKTVEIIAVLKAGLGDQDSSWLSSQTLYTNPTVERLAKNIFDRLQPTSNGHPVLSENARVGARNRVELMTGLVQKYTNGMHTASPTATAPSEGQCIAVTGSTGSLGRSLLRQLLAFPLVTRIYCLDRSINASTKHRDTLTDHHVSLQGPNARVNFLKVEYGQANFGLPTQTYKELLNSVDTIIHTAWKVDFNHSLESFEPIHIRGVRHLVDWQIQSPRRPHIVFISSTSSVSRWPMLSNNKKPIPDEFIEDHSAAQMMGYAESKNVAEHILYEASQEAKVSSTVLRVGQIAGPLMSKGVWNEDEWVPALINSSKSLGCLPKGVPDVDWIPVDSLACIIAELSFCSRRGKGSSFFNLVNPHLTTWETLLQTLRYHIDSCSTGSKVEIVSLSHWIERLKRLDTTNKNIISQYPAVKILDFFQSLAAQQNFGKVQYRVQNAVEASQTMAALPAVGPKAMEVWLKQWGY